MHQWMDAYLMGVIISSPRIIRIIVVVDTGSKPGDDDRCGYKLDEIMDSEPEWVDGAVSSDYGACRDKRLVCKAHSYADRMLRTYGQ